MKAKYFVLFAIMVVFSACDTTVQTGNNAGKIMPNITGGAGEALVVVDKYIWDGRTGELMKDILMEEFPGLPQSEPLFSLTQITPGSFDKLFKFHRSIVLVTIEEGLAEPQVKFRKNVYAKPQIMVQLLASNSEDLYTLLEENKSKIQNFLVQYDRQRLTDSYLGSKDLEIQKQIANNHQIRLGIPRGYNVDFSRDDYSSFSIETPEFSQVIQIFDYPGTEDDLQSSALLEKRNEFTRKYVKGPNENSYMTTATNFPPIFYDLTLKGKHMVEIRGLWELEGGFMGGPFVSHSVFDANRGRIVTVEGYLYYPNQRKGVKLRQLEAIVYSLEIL